MCALFVRALVAIFRKSGEIRRIVSSPMIGTTDTSSQIESERRRCAWCRAAYQRAVPPVVPNEQDAVGD
jgi:hypothetical protein